MRRAAASLFEFASVNIVVQRQFLYVRRIGVAVLAFLFMV
jgi:hypothetical protein